MPQAGARGRSRRPPVPLIQADFRDFVLEAPADLIVLPFHSIGHLLTDDDKLRAMRQVRSQLRDGGRFLFDHFLFDPSFVQPGVPRLRAEFRNAETGRDHILWEASTRDMEHQVIRIVVWTDEIDSGGIVVSRRYRRISLSSDHSRAEPSAPRRRRVRGPGGARRLRRKPVDSGVDASNLGGTKMNLPTFSLLALELVLRGGRVMDPETGLAAMRNVGIEGGTIVAISEEPLEGTVIVDASGLVVAPGFINLHAHGQDPVSNRLQAQDGVTTALEMEIGVYPVGAWLASREGKAVIHYGGTVGHLPARAKLFHGIDAGSWALGDDADPNRQRLMKVSDYAYKATSGDEQPKLEALMVRGLEEGGLGFGLGITYTPGATREEILRLFELARAQNVPIYVHLRGEGSGGTLGAFQECIANAAATGASLHIVHMNSSAGDLGADYALDDSRGARGRSRRHDRGLSLHCRVDPPRIRALRLLGGSSRRGLPEPAVAPDRRAIDPREL